MPDTNKFRDRSRYKGPLARLEDSLPDAQGVNLQYPNDLATLGKWMTFSAYEYSKPSRDQVSRVSNDYKGIVRLPLPQQLAVAYSQEYNPLEMGAGGTYFLANNGAEDSMQAIAASTEADFTQALQAAQRAMPNALKGFGINIIDRIIKNNTEGRAGLGDLITVGTGIARNPNLAMLYKGTGFRKFNFQWKMIARNRQEATRIQSIIRFLKMAQAPTYTLSGQGQGLLDNLLFNYPYIWDINFEPAALRNNLFQFVPAVLTDINIDYHADGNAYYFDDQGSKIPASVSLTLSFDEITIFTREDIEEFNF